MLAFSQGIKGVLRGEEGEERERERDADVYMGSMFRASGSG